MHPIFDNDPISDDEMLKVKKHGNRVCVRDNEHEVTAYLYLDRVYIDDVKKVDKND